MLAEFTEEKMWHEKKGSVPGGQGKKVIKQKKWYITERKN